MIDKIGILEKSGADCRTLGCGQGAECIRDGTIFVCRCQPGTSGSSELACTAGKNVGQTNLFESDM